MKLLRIVSICMKQAAKSKHRHKHGAVIFKQGKVISRGHNETKHGNSKFKGYWSGSLHAEISAIIKANTSLDGCSICVVRSNLRTSFPCVSCMAALKKVGIKNLYYSDDGAIMKERIQK